MHLLCCDLANICCLMTVLLSSNFKSIKVTLLYATVVQILFREIGPLWPQLDHSQPLGPPPGMPSLRLTVLSGSRSASLSLFRTYFHSQGLRTGRATEWSLLGATLYKFRNTLRVVLLQVLKI